MKHTLKQCLVFLLTALLALSPLAVLAENGPAPGIGDLYLSGVVFTELDETGSPVTDNGVPVQYYVYDQGAAHNDVLPGATYDTASNTLTIKDLNEKLYALELYAMGDDFQLIVKGSCRLAHIGMHGREWGCSLHIGGTGKLTVNEDLFADTALEFYPEEAMNLRFMVDGAVKVHLYGKTNTVAFYCYRYHPVLDIGDMDIAPEKVQTVREQIKTASGYFYSGNETPVSTRLATAAEDPNGTFSYEVGYNDFPQIVEVRITHYFFYEQEHLWLPDVEWPQRHGGTGPSLVFDSPEAAAAAGFTPRVEDGEDVYMDMKILNETAIGATVFQDTEGAEYIVWGGKAASVKALPNMDGWYLFTYTDAVDPGTLTEVTEMAEIRDRYDYFLRGTELHIEGGQHEHRYIVMQMDESYHWYKCADCDEITEKTPHSGGTAICNAKARCEVCGTEYGEFGDHSYTLLRFNEEGHWYECANGCGNVTRSQPHSGGTATCRERARCDLCGIAYGKTKDHVFTVLKSDGDAHWYECANGCGERTERDRHIGGQATCTAKAKCEVCNTEYGEFAPHNYTVLRSDHAGHWYECANGCGSATRKEDHVGGEATYERGPICEICGYEYGEPLDDHGGPGGDDGPHFTPGDVDGDGKVSTKDARLALRAAIGLEHYGEESPQFLSSDVNMNGKVETEDARHILRAAIDLEDPGDWGRIR